MLRMIFLGLLFCCLCGCVMGAAQQPRDRAAGIGIVETEAKGKYVVIAYSPLSKKVYLGRSYQSAAEALDKAVSSCAYSDCKVSYVSAEDMCAAYAFSAGLGWGRATGPDAEAASKKALKLCNAWTDDDSCRVVATVCPEY